MSHEILSVKLCELEKRIAGMEQRIRLSQSASPPKIREGLAALHGEYAENQLALQNKLRNSHGQIVGVLLSAYGEIGPAIGRAEEKIRAVVQSYADRELATEAKLLLAEYMLDFSMLAADRATMISLDAIADQLEISREETEI